MTFIYYLFAIVGIIVESTTIHDPKEVCQFILMSKDRSVSFENKPYEYKSFMLFNLVYALWTIVGLFTFQWYAFLKILILSFIPKRANVVWRVIDSIICLALILFIVINKYQLHIHLLSK